MPRLAGCDGRKGSWEGGAGVRAVGVLTIQPQVPAGEWIGFLLARGDTKEEWGGTCPQALLLLRQEYISRERRRRAPGGQTA